MSKTKKIILIVLGLVSIGSIALWYISRPTNSGTVTNNGGFSVKNFFPFGNTDEVVINDNNNDQTDNTTNNTNSTNTETLVPIVKLRKLSDRPVSGAVIFNKASTSIVRFVERATGNVYEARSDSNTINRLTNETIPKISRVIWLKDGSGFLAQRLDDNEVILTSFIKLKTSATSTKNNIPFEAVISNLPTDINEVSVSPDSKKIFYYTVSDKASGFISNPDGTNPTLVFSNYLTEWIPEWFNGNNISISTKASSGIGSYGFILNSNNKTLSKTYSNIASVSSLISPDGKNLIIGDGLRSISLFKTSDSSISNINIRTLPEKCVWDRVDTKFIYCGVPRNAPSANYPDDWYKGVISTNDLIQKINVFDNYTYILSDTKKDVGVDIDVSNIKSSNDGYFLIFTNKKDSSLWMLDTR